MLCTISIYLLMYKIKSSFYDKSSFYAIFLSNQKINRRGKKKLFNMLILNFFIQSSQELNSTIKAR